MDELDVHPVTSDRVGALAWLGNTREPCRSRFPGHRSHLNDAKCVDELARMGPDHAAHFVGSRRRAAAGVQSACFATRHGRWHYRPNLGSGTSRTATEPKRGTPSGCSLRVRVNPWATPLPFRSRR
ncbi:MAG TPA: hypothetical protein VMW47_08975 [Verrucomicrobiae bacterium]|nr:hypothetical protein [Verrucomicrobiae bacterium]